MAAKSKKTKDIVLMKVEGFLMTIDDGKNPPNPTWRANTHAHGQEAPQDPVRDQGGGREEEGEAERETGKEKGVNNTREDEERPQFIIRVRQRPPTVGRWRSQCF